MKLKHIFFTIFIFAILFISCHNSDDLIETTIAGKWNVTQTIGGFSQPKNYNKGSFTWEFNMTEKTITIINTADIFITVYSPSFINNQGGVYPFEIITENGTDFLLVGNRKAPINLDQNKLTLDYGVALDDIGYIFNR